MSMQTKTVLRGLACDPQLKKRYNIFMKAIQKREKALDAYCKAKVEADIERMIGEAYVVGFDEWDENDKVHIQFSEKMLDMDGDAYMARGFKKFTNLKTYVSFLEDYEDKMRAGDMTIQVVSEWQFVRGTQKARKTWHVVKCRSLIK
jgi:hypothetical protein